MFKKWYSIFTVLVATMVFVAGCTKPSAPTANSDTAPEESTVAKDNTAVASAGDKTKLEIWHIQTTAPMPDIYQGSIDRFMQENPQYDVKITITANDAYKQKLAVAMGSGQMPDIYPSWSGGPMNEYIDAGHAQDLTEYMNKDGFKDMFLDSAIAQGTYKDKIYAVPVENVSICGIFYNKELFEELGLTEPKTLAELEAVCETIKANGKTPFSLANKSQWTGSMYYMNFVTRFGGLKPFQDAVSGAGSFDSEAFEFAGNKTQEWVDKGYFNVGFNGTDEDSGQSRQLLYTNEAVMTVMGSWFVGTVKGENPEFYEKVGFFLFPGIEGAAGDPNIVVGTVGDQFYSISGSCKDVEGAFGVVKSLLDDTAQKERLESGRIIPLKGVEPADPILKVVMEKVNAAPAVQLWYDQYLPPELGDLHKTTSQEIFGKTMTPKEADQKMQEAMEAYRAKK